MKKCAISPATESHSNSSDEIFYKTDLNTAFPVQHVSSPGENACTSSAYRITQDQQPPFFQKTPRHYKSSHGEIVKKILQKSKTFYWFRLFTLSFPLSNSILSYIFLYIFCPFFYLFLNWVKRIRVTEEYNRWKRLIF